MARRAAVFLVLAAVAACGGEVVIPNASSEGTGGAGGSGGFGGGVGGSGDGGSTTVSSSSSGTGGSIACGETHDEVEIVLSRHDGHVYGCGAEAGVIELDAAVTEYPSDGIIVLDECSPAADCVPFLDKLSIQAPDFFADLAPGTYVHVRLRIMPFMGGCGQSVEIYNLPSWDGSPNPIWPEPIVWVLASDGIEAPLPGSPVTVEHVPLGCFPNEPPGCGDHEDYAFRFSSAAQPDNGVLVGMGDTQFWQAELAQGPQGLLARNLRSFSTGWCDGPVDFAYWMTRVIPID